jgi:hypothetical protein
MFGYHTHLPLHAVMIVYFKLSVVLGNRTNDYTWSILTKTYCCVGFKNKHYYLCITDETLSSFMNVITFYFLNCILVICSLIYRIYFSLAYDFNAFCR